MDTSLRGDKFMSSDSSRSDSNVETATKSKPNFIIKLMDKVSEKYRFLVFTLTPILIVILVPVIYLIISNFEMECKAPTFPDGSIVVSKLDNRGAIVKSCVSENFGTSKREKYCVKTSSYTNYDDCDVDVFELLLYVPRRNGNG